jgi:F-type H+-transporting ATPase subunit a
MHEFNWYQLIPGLKEFAGHNYVHVLGASIITVIILIFSVSFYIRLIRNKDVTPSSKISATNFLEMFSDLILGLAKDSMGEKNAKKYFPLLGSMFVYIVLNNVVGLIPGILPATDNINTTLSCGILIFIYYNYQGFKEHGFKYLKQFVGPLLWLSPLMIPIELVSHAVRPLSLGLRLYGNIFGDHLVLNIFSDLVPYGVPIVFYGLGFFISVLQAGVFVLLSMIYLTLALSHDH